MTLHDQAVQTLETFIEAAAIAGVPFVLSSGTLLGAIRDGDFAAGDEDDIDVSVMNHHWPRLGRLTEGLWFRATDRFIFRENVEGIKVELVGNPVHVDIQRMHRHPDRDEVYNFGRVNIAGERVFVVDMYPGYHFRHLGSINFHGHVIGIPNDAEKLLEWRYGREWRKPMSREVWDWPSRIPNDCVRTDYDELTR
jgi:hypothetical protein